MRGTTKVDLETARLALGHCVLFQHLAPAVRDQIVARAKIHSFAARKTIFSTGTMRNSLMAVLSGNVQITATSPDGGEIVLAIFHPGEVFGEIALLDGKERSANARAMTDCEIAVIERADVLALLEHHPEAWRGFVDVLCARLRATDDQLVEIALLELPARLARTILRSAEDDSPGAAAASGPKSVRLSQRDLGNMVGASRERVNRWLHVWQRSNIVRVEKGAIVVRDEAALRSVARIAGQLSPGRVRAPR